MKSLLFLIIMAAHLPAFAQDYDLSSSDLAHEVVLRGERQRSPQDAEETLALIRYLNTLVQTSLDARFELEATVEKDPRLLLDLIQLAEKPETAKCGELSELIFTVLRVGTMPVLLTEVQRPELSATSVMNLLSVFRSWVIRDEDLSQKIRIALDVIEANYRNEGYILGMRIGKRLHTNQEEANVIHLIRLIKVKNIAKLK